MKGPGLLIARTMLQTTLFSFVNLLLVLAFLLLILLNLKPIFYILLHSPGIFNGFSPCFRLYELVAFEVFEDGQEVAFENISKTVFFLNGKEGKQVVDGWKGMFVVIVADDDLRDYVFLFGLGNRCYLLLLFRRYKLYLWFYLYSLFFGLHFILYLLHNVLLYFCFDNHIMRILFFLGKPPILSSRLIHSLLDIRLLREWL